MTVRNYAIDYLLPYRDTPDAAPDKTAKGWYRHRTVVPAVSSSSAVAEVSHKEEAIVTGVKEVRPPHPWFRRVPKSYKLQFLHAIRFNLKGMSPGMALELVIENETAPYLRGLMSNALMSLKMGGGFADGMRALNFFDDTVLAILESGERGGMMDVAITSAIEQYQLSQSAQKVMLGAVTMTMGEIFMAASSLVGVKQYLESIDPAGTRFANPLKKQEFIRSIELAAIVTDVLLWGTFVLIVAVAFTTYAYAGGSLTFRKRVDGWLRRIPFLNKAILHDALASTMKIASSLLKGGVGLLSAVELARRGTRVPDVYNYWTHAQAATEAGESSQHAFAGAPLMGSERMIVASHTNQMQLGEAFGLITLERAELAKVASKRFGIWMGVACIAYLMVSVLFMVWVLYLQYNALMSNTATGM